jgi:hypothetical protein
MINQPNNFPFLIQQHHLYSNDPKGVSKVIFHYRSTFTILATKLSNNYLKFEILTLAPNFLILKFFGR